MCIHPLLMADIKRVMNLVICSDVHGNMDRLVCQDCGKLFTSKRSLFGHKKEKHSGPVEVFPCVDCGKNFSRKANLKVNKKGKLVNNKFMHQRILLGSQRFLTFWKKVSMFFL